MLNIIITIIGILFIAFLMKFYKEYDKKDKAPLPFIVFILLAFYFGIIGLLYFLRIIESFSSSYMYLIIFFIVLPVIYFLTLKYLLKNKLFVYFRDQTQIYMQSFRHMDKRLLYSILLNLALVIICLGVILLFVMFMRGNLTPIIKDVLPLLKAANSDQNPAAKEQMMMTLLQNKELINSAITSSIIGLSLVLIVILFVMSVFKGFIWSNILRQKYDKIFFRRFTFVSLVWLLLSLVVIALVLFLFELRVGVIIAPVLLLMFMYFKLMINLNFSKEKTVAKNLGSFKKGFTKFHRMIVPFMFIFSSFAVFFVLGLILLGLGGKMYASVMAVFLAILLISFINWARFYLSRVFRTASV